MVQGRREVRVLVRLRFMAMLREQRGRAYEELHVADGLDAAGLYADLFPAPRVPVTFAVNHRLVAPETTLADGDEVVFLPPVGGG